MKLGDRIKSKIASINIISVAFFGLSIFSIAFAWFAYTNIVSANLEADVQSWKIEFKRTDNHQVITNEVSYQVNDLYPGCEEFYKMINIQNYGDLDAVIEVDVKYLRVFNEVISDDITLYEMNNRYPFKINLTTYNNPRTGNQQLFYLDSAGSGYIGIGISWDLDSGNDELDTSYGNMAYDFYQSENQLHQNNPNYQIRSGLEIKLEIKATQYIDETNSFATDSWRTIQLAVQKNNLSKYHVGDTKNVSINGTNHTVRIANMSTPSECTQSDFSKTACGFVVEFADIIEDKKMNSTLTSEPWPSTELHSYLQGNLFSSLPYELRKAICQTMVVSGSVVGNSGIMQTSNDSLYLLSPSEIYKSFYTESISSKTRELDYYTTQNPSHNTQFFIKEKASVASPWWTRSLYSSGNSYSVIPSVGGFSFNSVDTSIGVSPAFRIS